MTQSEQVVSPPEATSIVGAAHDRFASVMARLASAIEHEISPGDASQLRRLQPEDPGTPAFWKLLAAYLEPAGELPSGGAARDEAECHWAAILAGMASMRGLHRHGRRPGLALAAAGYSELRFVRLLRARDAALLDAVRGVATFLASKGESVDWLQIARLIRCQDGEAGERLRRAIARDYYRALQQGEH